MNNQNKIWKKIKFPKFPKFQNFQNVENFENLDKIKIFENLDIFKILKKIEKFSKFQKFSHPKIVGARKNFIAAPPNTLNYVSGDLPKCQGHSTRHHTAAQGRTVRVLFEKIPDFRDFS